MTPNASALQAPEPVDDLRDLASYPVEGMTSCRQCADKDQLIAGLKRMNAQLAAALDALRAERKDTPSG